MPPGKRNGCENLIMAKPALIAVDDEPEVLRSVERDLRRKYGQTFRIVRADSGPTALDAVQRLKERSETVALFLADQRMPVMSGVEFLAQATHVFPAAKKVLTDRICRHKRGHRCNQSSPIGLLLIEAVGSARSRIFILYLTIYWKTGMRTFRPPFDGSRVLDTGGRRTVTRSKISLGETRSPMNGWTLLAGMKTRWFSVIR